MWSSFIAQVQAQPWLYGLVVGSLVFAVFWAIDHVASHAMVRYIPVQSPTYRRNLVGILRRVLLLCAAGLLLVADYLVLLPTAWQNKLSLTVVAIPIAAAIIAVWLVVEARLMRQVVLGDAGLRSWWQQQQLARTPTAIGQEPTFGVGDFVRMPPAQKQLAIQSPAFTAPSARLNTMLYLLDYAHVVLYVYALRVTSITQ